MVKMKLSRVVTLLVLLVLTAAMSYADSLDDLAADFWAWRANEQPISTDDIPRLERPKDWVPDWSPQTIARCQEQLKAFQLRHKGLNAEHWPVPRQVDFRLMGSALARVQWELNILRSWQVNPNFYVDQTAGAYLN